MCIHTIITSLTPPFFRSHHVMFHCDDFFESCNMQTGRILICVATACRDAYKRIGTFDSYHPWLPHTLWNHFVKLANYKPCSWVDWLFISWKLKTVRVLLQKRGKERKCSKITFYLPTCMHVRTYVRVHK